MSDNDITTKIFKEVGHIRWTVVILVGMMIIMAYATYIEAQEGHTAAMERGFHGWPMDTLIVALALNLTACTLLRAPFTKRQIPWLITHLGLLLTMAGTVVSHRTTLEGQILLRSSKPEEAVRLFLDTPTVYEAPLGFQLELDSFAVKYYPGTGKAKDFISYVRMLDYETEERDTFTIRVNHPLVKNGWNLSQSSFIPGDDRATILGANKDPGTPISYAGFLTVGIGLITMFFLRNFFQKKSDGSEVE